MTDFFCYITFRILRNRICEASPARTGLGERCEGTLSLLVIPSFREIAVLVNDGSKLGDFRADFDTIVTKTCTFM